MRYFYFLILFLFISCDSLEEYRIVILDRIPLEVYEKELDKLNEEITKKKSNRSIIERKIEICDQLGWKGDNCQSVVDYMSLYKDNRSQYHFYLMDYYVHFGETEKFVKLLDKNGMIPSAGGDMNTLKGIIISLVKTSRKIEAENKLQQISNTSITHSEELLGFLGEQYLLLKDSILSVYYFKKLEKINPNSIYLTDQYVDLLLSMKLYEGVEKIYEKKYKTGTANMNDIMKLVRIYRELNKNTMALMMLDKIRHTREGKHELIGMYEKLNLLKDAILLVDSLLLDAPDDIQLLTRKAELYEKRRWFTSSLSVYAQLNDLMLGDSIIEQKIRNLLRKIDYINRKKFEKSKIETFEIKPKIH